MPKQTEQLAHLDQVRKHTLAEIERLKEELQAEIEPASATDDDSADVAADIYERGKIISLIQSLDSKVHALEHAMAVAKHGKYGICEMCGDEIPAERLEIMPETTYCVRCAGKVEEGIRRRQLQMSDAARRAEDLESEDEDNDGDDDDDEAPDGDEDA